jgi:hypothetical protein
VSDRDETLRRIALMRHAQHVDDPTHRPLSPDYEMVAMIGERSFGRFCGRPIDDALRPAGDGGKDQTIRLRMNDGGVREFTVDVKTARKPFHLIVEVGKVRADIFVLCCYRTEALLGWAWAQTMRAAPVRDFGYGVLNHYVPARSLRHMDELAERMIR